MILLRLQVCCIKSKQWIAFLANVVNCLLLTVNFFFSRHFIAAKIVGVITLSVLAYGCQDALEDRYLNPDRTTEPSVENYFTRMQDNNRVRPAYWEMSTFINWHIGVYTQSVGFLNSESVYQQNDAYIADRWDDFYRPGVNGAGVMANFRALEKEYASLRDDEQEQKEVFLQAARVILFDQVSQMVDLWGDVPFSEAGMLTYSGDVVYPKFDDAAEIYRVALEGLKSSADFFASASLAPGIQVLFTKQDIVLNGNLGRWQRYANALRLRLLMRISFVNEIEAAPAIQQMLNNPQEHPLPGDGASYNPATDDVLLQPLADYTDDLRNAFSDWTNYPAPYFLVEEVLKPANDPRLEVLFDKYGTVTGSAFKPNTTFNGMPLELSRIEQQQNLGNYAVVDSATFLYNNKLPGIIFTAAEVSFLKAEAYERWGGGDPGAMYRTAIMQSIDFYYYLNALNSIPRTPHTPPSMEVKIDFVTNTISIQYAGTQEEKLSKIWTQKWAHFGFLQAVQSWAEIRRTHYPQLTFKPSSLSGYELPPSRLLYPPGEKTFNRSNYTLLAEDDNREHKIFWDVR
jgi:hypothetical protein